MPTYEYECATCGNSFEYEQKITEEPLKDCPRCGNSVKRVISNGSFILKGSGWYISDYARKSSSSASKETKTNTCANASVCGGCPSSH